MNTENRLTAVRGQGAEDSVRTVKALHKEKKKDSRGQITVW